MELRKSKVFRLVLAFDGQEVDAFTGWLGMKGGKVSSRLIEGFYLMRKHEEKIRKGKIDESGLFPALFPGQDFNKRIFAKFGTELVKRIEEFWGTRKLIFWGEEGEHTTRLEQLARGLGYAKMLYSKCLFSDCENALALLERDLNQMEHLNSNFYLLRFWLAELRLKVQQVRRPRENRPQLVEAQRAMTNYFIAEAMKFQAAIASQERMDGKQSRILETEAILNFPTPETFSQNLVAKLFHDALLMQAETSIAEWESSVERFRVVEESLAHPLPLDLKILLLNPGIRLLNKGGLGIAPHIWELYKSCLHGKVFWGLEDSQKLAGHLLNIVQLGTALGDFDHVEEILNQFHFATFPNGDASRLFVSGVLAYKKEGDLDKALSLFLQFDQLVKEDILLMAGRIFIFRIFFEAKAYDEMNTFMYQRTRILIRRKKEKRQVSLEHYENFIRYVKKASGIMRNLLVGKYKKQLKALRKEIEEEPTLLCKAWFLEVLPQKK